jgi:protein-disulfide isomerase
MSKARTKSRAQGSGSELYIIVGLGAVIVVLGLIVLGGGFAPPTTMASDALDQCNGRPCPAKGDPDAPVTMVEFSDYACSHCRDYNLGTASIVEQEYVETGKVRYVAHIYALRPETEPAAAAAWCASDQGKFWEFHHTAFANQSATSYPATTDLLSWGRQIGLDETAFAECVNSGRHLQDVRVAELEGQRAGVTGTPTFFVNGRAIQGNVPLDEFRNVLDAALAGQ